MTEQSPFDNEMITTNTDLILAQVDFVTSVPPMSDAQKREYYLKISEALPNSQARRLLAQKAGEITSKAIEEYATKRDSQKIQFNEVSMNLATDFSRAVRNFISSEAGQAFQRHATGINVSPTETGWTQEFKKWAQTDEGKRFLERKKENNVA